MELKPLQMPTIKPHDTDVAMMRLLYVMFAEATDQYALRKDLLRIAANVDYVETYGLCRQLIDDFDNNRIGLRMRRS